MVDSLLALANSDQLQDVAGQPAAAGKAAAASQTAATPPASFRRGQPFAEKVSEAITGLIRYRYCFNIGAVFSSETVRKRISLKP